MSTTSKEKLSRISLDDVRKRMDEVVFVDARSATALSHNPVQVPGAIHLPVKELPEGTKRLPRNRPIVTYCTCSDEKTSARVARQLKENGFFEVYPLRGGFKSWQRAGLPVEPVAR